MPRLGPCRLLPLSAAVLLGCSHQELAHVSPQPSVDMSTSDDLGPSGPSDRALHCPPARSIDLLPQRQAATVELPKMSFEDLRLVVTSACRGCHLAPSETGGFTFASQYHETTAYVNGMKVT